MGKEIESIAVQSGHSISFVIDFNNQIEITKINTTNTDVIIEFTKPDSVISNMQKAFEQNIPFITGTTGWNQHLEHASELCKRFNGTLFYSSNFSIGVGLFMEFAKSITQKLHHYKEYNLRIEETHHTQKLDSPSGTAITLANNILPFLPELTSWKTLNEAQENDLPIHSHRENDVVGIHNLIFESECDSIELNHKAKNRKGFASGAIAAADFVKDKKGIFTMTDLINK